MNAGARASRIVGGHSSLSVRLQNKIAPSPHVATLCRFSSLVPKDENLPARLIDFSISAKIEGEESQVAMVTLRPGETLRAESGAMLFMTQGVDMSTDLQGASAAFSRMMTGQNLFLSDFTYSGEKGEGTVGLGTDFPSKIVRLTLEDYENSTIVCQRGAYLASNPSVNIDMEYTKSLSAGFFGGQGFILQRLSGQGDVLVKAGGTLVERDLEEGECIRVTSGSIVAFTPTVEYDIQMMPGVKNAMFGGEGLFVTTLKGPGKIWLQGMPADRMIGSIAQRIPSRGPGIGIPIPVGGGGGEVSGAGAEAAGDGAEIGAAGVATGAGVEGVDGNAADGGTFGAPEDIAGATIQMDRQATVASSSASESELDSDSPSALFGDAAPSDTTSTPGGTDDMAENSFFQGEQTFTDDSTTFMDETSFSDETNFSTSDFDQSQDSFWSEMDQTTTDVFDSGASEEASSTVSSILSTLWDIVTGDD